MRDVLAVVRAGEVHERGGGRGGGGGGAQRARARTRQQHAPARRHQRAVGAARHAAVEHLRARQRRHLGQPCTCTTVLHKNNSRTKEFNPYVAEDWNDHWRHMHKDTWTRTEFLRIKQIPATYEDRKRDTWRSVSLTWSVQSFDYPCSRYRNTHTLLKRIYT